MDKIGRIISSTIENEISKNLKDTDTVFIVEYSGVSGPEMNSLRQSLKTNRSNFFVVKNSITKRVFNNMGLTELSRMLTGPCGLVFTKEDLIAASRVLYNFAKEHQTFRIQGGLLKNRLLTKSDITNLAMLPSKEVLYTKLVTQIQNPLNRLVGVLNNALTKFVIVLEEIKKKKGAS